MREESGRAPHWLARSARHCHPRALVYRCTWVLFLKGSECWLHGRVAGAWSRRSSWGTRRGPHRGFPMALCAGHRGCPHRGLPAPSEAWAGELGSAFRALSKPWRRLRFPPGNIVFSKPGLRSLTHIPGTKPPASLRPGSSARPACAATGSGADFTGPRAR